jgi:hypothetical protein
MVWGQYIAKCDNALNYHEDNTMLAPNPASGNMIESPVYTYGRNSFLWNGDEYVSCIDQPFNSHKDNQSHLNAYKEKKTPFDSLKKKRTMSKVPMFPSVGFGDHYVPGIGHPILRMLYPSFYKHYVRDTGDPVKPSEEKMSFEVYPPFGDHFIPDNGDPIKSHEVDTAANEVVLSDDNNTTDKTDDKNSTNKTDEKKSTHKTDDNKSIDKTDDKKLVIWPCPDCGQIFKNKRNLKPHIWLKHTERDVKEVEASKKKENECRKKNAAKKQYGCSKCDQVFGEKHHAKEHIRVLHPDQKDAMIIQVQTEANEKKRKSRA